MKKLFTIIAVFLLGTVCFAQMPSLSSVNVRPITADYNAATPTVTFEVTWPNDRNNDHRSKVWLLVDYRRIKDNAYAPGWSRAEITVPAEAITTTAGSTVTIEPGNTSGFWLQGTDGAFAATVTVPVTVDLNGYAPQFGWCGVAIDRPPYAKEEPGSYTLFGTPDFIIQTIPGEPGSTVSQPTPTYNNCIYGLTDATGCPDEWPAMPVINDFTASATAICAGESVTLTATATDAEQYSFDNGQTWDNSSSTVVSPLTTTDYTLQVRSVGGCTVTAATTITVTVNPAPIILSLTSATICYGGNVTLTATMGGGTTSAMTYSCNFGGYPITLYTDSFDYGNLQQSTTYSVIARNEYGCESDLSTGTLTVLPIIQQDTPAHRSVCAGASVTFDLAEATGGRGSFTYQWEQTVESADFNSTWVPAEGENTGATYTTPPLTQSMRYRRTAMNECGSNTNVSQAMISVNPVPEILSLTSATICYGAGLTLRATMGGGTTSAMTYSYNAGGHPITLYTDSFDTGILYESMTYSVIARNEYGCESALSTGTVTVLPSIQQDTPAHRTVCAGASVAFNLAEATGGRGSFTYQWEQTVESANFNSTWVPAEGENTGATYTTLPLTQSMRYRRTAMNECGSNTNFIPAMISVDPNPEILSLTASPDAVCAGESATLTASANSNNVKPASYSLNGKTWQPEAVFEVTPPASTTYTLYVKNDYGCTATLPDAATVTVNDLPAVSSLTSATVCYGESATLTASASGAASYSIDNSHWQADNTFEVTPETTTTYTLYVQSAAGCMATLTDAATVTVNDLPAIILASGSTAQTVTYGDAVTQIQYTITNASATATGLPTGVSGTWSSNVYTISGTPTSVGTYNYTVTTTNSNGCTNATATGKITITFPLPTDTWSCGAQTWSGALRNPAGCALQSSLSEDNPPPAQYYDRGSSYGYYYNWTCVNENATTLCPSPWHVPTQSDFNTLITCAGGEGSDGGSTIMNAWGATGYVVGSRVFDDTYGFLWSSELFQPIYPYTMYYHSSFLNVTIGNLYRGTQVRCVR